MENPLSDNELLKKFSQRGDESAFSEFVGRHLNLVYSVALRHLNGDSHLAEDVAQTVFSDAAQKAARLSKHPAITGWLFTSARFSASKLARGRIRQASREQSAATIMEIERTAETEPIDPSLLPMIDEALEKLPETDRNAILLRFYGELDYRAIGAQLGMPSGTARMRVERALPRLQTMLTRGGVPMTSAALGTALSAQTLNAAPAGLSLSIAANAVSLATTSSAGIFASLGTAKAPLATTAAILTAGALLQFNLPREQMPDVSAVSIQLPMPDSQAEEMANPAQNPTFPEQRNTQRDPIERAYAALDKDAAFLAERFDQIAAQYPNSSGKSTGDTEVFSIKDLDVTPRATDQAPPEYPKSFLGTDSPGGALIQFTIDENGRTTDLAILDATHPEFGASALESLRKSRFEPGEIANAPVATRVRQRIEFRPRGIADTQFENWFYDANTHVESNPDNLQ